MAGNFILNSKGIFVVINNFESIRQRRRCKDDRVVSRKEDERGIVLLILLWTLVLLSLLALNLASSVQTETAMARTTLDSEQAYFFTRGALEEAMYKLIFSNQDKDKQNALFPYRDGMNHYWVRKGEYYSHVAILDEAGKLDINFCDRKMLQRLLLLLGNEETLSENLAAAIMEWRKPDSTSGGANTYGDSSLGPDVQYIKHRPFTSVEELLQVPGMNREILYGSVSSEVDEEGLAAELNPPKRLKGLVNYVTVFSGKDQINPNYAELEVLASLPEMDKEEAQEIINARREEIFKSPGDITERTTLLLQGEALSKLSTESAKVYSLIASGSLKNSRVRRSISAVIKKNQGAEDPVEKLMWQDEYWAPPHLLSWLSQEEAAPTSEQYPLAKP